MSDAVVVGGGISGLAAAWALADAGFDVLVLEAGPRVGGKLRVETVAGVEVDTGAEAMLARRPEGVQLARAAGREADVLAPLVTSAAIRAGGRLRPLPARTLLGIPTDVDAARDSGALSEDALAAVVAEPELDPLPPLHSDVAVGALVRERLGDEVADRLVEPLLGGVYAGRADALSLQATVPALAARLRSGGSLVRTARTLTGAGAGTADRGRGPGVRLAARRAGQPARDAGRVGTLRGAHRGDRPGCGTGGRPVRPGLRGRRRGRPAHRARRHRPAGPRAAAGEGHAAAGRPRAGRRGGAGRDRVGERRASSPWPTTASNSPRAAACSSPRTRGWRSRA